MADPGDFTKEVGLAMEQTYLPRVLTLEVALMTCLGILDEYVRTIDDVEIKDLTTNHLKMVTKVLDDKEYLKHVFDEDMKQKLNATVSTVVLDEEK